MARNFYKKDGSYYYSDNGQKILNFPELQDAAKAGGTEVPPPAPTNNTISTLPSTGARNFYKRDGSYYYSDNNQKILNRNDLQDAAKAGGTEVPPPSTSTPFQANPNYSFGQGTIPGQAPVVETQESIDSLYYDAIAKNPKINELTQGGSTLEEIITALQTGDLSGIVDFNGQPFSAEDQQAALTQAMEDNRLYYEALQQKETADAEAALAQNVDDYQNYLISSGQSFEADKAKSDQQAANQGVLFSGSRVQKEKNMQRAYQQDQDYTRNKVARNIGNTASDFQYKYGNEAAGGLNQYYNLGGNTYNPNKARGGVGSSSLSNVYQPSNYTFQGTRNTARSADANTRAAGYLWNKGNKLLRTGYNNQY